MTVERLAPNVLVTQTNLTGAVTDIDDDPDSPDGNWLTTSGGNDVTCEVSFPDASGDLTSGAGNQRVKVYLRRTNNSTRTPTFGVAIYEGGTLVTTLASTVTLSSTTGALYSYTWDSSLLTDETASSDVRVRVTGTRTGGPGSQRNSVEVGAIEWNADYSESSTDVTSTLATLSLTANASTVFANNEVASTLAALSLTPFASTARADTEVVSGLASLTFTGYATTVNAANNVASNLASLALTPFASTVATGEDTEVQSTLATLTLTAYATAAGVETNVESALASLTFTSYATVVNAATNVASGLAGLTLTPFASTVATGEDTEVQSTLAALTLTPFASIVTSAADTEVVSSLATLTLTAYASAVLAGGAYPYALNLDSAQTLDNGWLDDFATTGVQRSRKVHNQQNAGWRLVHAGLTGQQFYDLMDAYDAGETYQMDYAGITYEVGFWGPPQITTSLGKNRFDISVNLRRTI